MRSAAEAEVDDPGPVALENGGGRGGFVFVCDHASNRIPPEFGTLGLDASARGGHIAWDPGALAVARGLARRLDGPLLHGTVSRLVVDCNRALDAADLIVTESDGVVVAANAGLGAAERRRRIDAVHRPYHAALAALLDGRAAAGRPTALVAVHSFTPVFGGRPRPWQAGIVFDRDRRLADPLVAGLAAEGVTVGVNQPYAPADGVYHTVGRHGEGRGLACAMIEIRNDEIAGPDGQDRWAARLAGLLAAAAGPLGLQTKQAAHAGRAEGGEEP